MVLIASHKVTCSYQVHIWRCSRVQKPPQDQSVTTVINDLVLVITVYFSSLFSPPVLSTSPHVKGYLALIGGCQDAYLPSSVCDAQWEGWCSGSESPRAAILGSCLLSHSHSLNCPMSQRHDKR